MEAAAYRRVLAFMDEGGDGIVPNDPEVPDWMVQDAWSIDLNVVMRPEDSVSK